MPNGSRTMSPTSRPSDGEDARRVLSPVPSSQNKQPNGNAIQSSYSSDAKGKKPMRPQRGDDLYGSSAENVDNSADTQVRERAKSPSGSERSKSPIDVEAPERAVSPQGNDIGNYSRQQPANMASLTMQRNVYPPRGSSPVVDRNKPTEGYFSSTGRASPTVNGVGPHIRPGSTGNVTADLIRDLKVKDAEVEEMRRRETWMRMTLKNATLAGFTTGDRELDVGRSDRQSPVGDDADVKALASVIVRLKQEQARIQVRFSNCFCFTKHCSDDFW